MHILLGGIVKLHQEELKICSIILKVLYEFRIYKFGHCQT
jgi:hypothetical protein